MILVFTDMQTYHNEWEMNPKRISSSVVIAWGSAYRPRKDYKFYDCFRLMQPYLNDGEYEEYIKTNEVYKVERAALAYAISVGVDIVFLCNENSDYLNDRLYELLYDFQERYGIRPVYIKCIEDIPAIPKHNDYFNILASVTLEEDQAILQNCLMDDSQTLPWNIKELKRQIAIRENIL